jgi:CRP-like cAMP-binding protein
MQRNETALLSLLPALCSNTWFASCPVGLQRALIERARVWQLAAGERLFARGDEADGLCCVLAGALHVGSLQADGSQRLLVYLEPYQWFGEISTFDGLPRTHDAVADGDTRLLLVPRRTLLDWLAAHPADWQHLGRLACGKLRLLFTVLEDITHLPLDRRLAKRLWLAAHGYDAPAAHTPPRRQLRVPQEQLALMMGVSRQSVNKVLRQFEAQGVIALRYGGIELLDLELLRRAAGLDAAGAGRDAPWA